MSKSALRAAILITGLITALVHLVLLNLSFLESGGSIDLLFTLNGLGTLAFLVLFFWDPDFVERRRTLLSYAFMAYILITILAWVAVGARTFVGYATKIDEVLLIAALWMYSRKEA